ncbi:zinc finger protein Xfin isoform X1 [Copidosoma floridanum]|uniref:zinc finger protein Xfin isoform X1 n=1 Tax=Copidosoma floridanum TaxID=29053 RepID=UPI0006C99FFC|nr:zinc finger protein Xfin isoform X1 [Copidosoma floridanum]
MQPLIPKERYHELCRLCATVDAVKMDLFGLEGKKRQLVEKIQTLLPFKIEEDDKLPKCLCYRCMYKLEKFFGFRLACINAKEVLSKHAETLESSPTHIKQEDGDMEPYSELRMELLKHKDGAPLLIPEASVVNPNAALGTPPRLKSDTELDIEDTIMDQHHDMDDHKSDEYEMDMETNPSDFLEMSAMVAEEDNALPQPSKSTAKKQQQQSEVFQHRNEQHEVYVCSLCNKAFSSKGHLSLHARIHVGAGDVIGEKVITDDHTSYKRPYQCDLCNKSYSTAKHRWGHVSTTHRGHPAVTCGFCSRIYSTRTNLEEHIKSRHAGQPPPPEMATQYAQQHDSRYQCKTCPKMYANITDLNKHSRVCHSEQQRRDAANSSYNPSNFSKLKNALDPNSDMSSMDSDYENKDYKSAEAKLAKNPHLTILKQALIKGEIVKKEYDERQKMLSKAKKQANATNRDNQDLDMKRWYCEACPLNFATVDELKQHEKTHDAEKPYICLLCEKDFAVKSSLSRHIIASHGVDPTPLVESDKCLKKSMQNANDQAFIKLEDHHIAKENSVSPYSDNLDNDDDEHENGNDNMLEVETVFVCEICTRDFNDRASLWLHIRATHKEYAAFACGVCLKICSDNAQLQNHVNMYHGGSKLAMSEQRRYSCTICGRQHDSRKKLINHVSIHNIDPSYDASRYVQLNTNYYNENMNSNEGNELIMDCDEESEKIDCYICYKSFPSEDHLIRHQRNAHKTDGNIPLGEYSGNGGPTGQNGSVNRAQYHLFFVCELCGSSYPSKWERWLHVSGMHGNEPSIRCEHDDCAKIFATKTLRNEHAQHHQLQGSSPNTCEICGKLWGSRVDYWKHVMGVHSDTVPLICGVCLKVFPDVMQLSQHVKQKHWPLTTGDFSCDICGRPYSNKSKMSRHRKIHGLDGEVFNPASTNSSLIIHDAMNEVSLESHQMDNGLPQPIEPVSMDLSCEMCGDLKFPCLEDLSTHRKVAHNLFPCDLCNKCYGRTSHLWKHVNRVHKGHEDITCRYCLKTSASRDHLAAHIAKIHRYEPEVKNDVSIQSFNSSKSTNLYNDTASANEEDGLHFCEKCNKSFHKRYLLRRHMKGCQNYRKDPGALLTRCRACERIFKDRASLQKHIENHHTLYDCHLCKETITSKLGIMTHNRMHHMHHPDLTCELESCRKLFRTKDDLESHRKDHKHHGNPNVCDFCGDTVENKLKLKMHILSLHRNEIGVSCGICLIPMNDPKDLKKHVEDSHPGVLDRPNTCQVCGKQYASKWKAFDHTKKCHGKVFRTCKQCLAVFTTDVDLRSHYEHVHNIPKDQLDAFQYRLEVAGNKMDDYDLGPVGPEVVVKEEPEELDFDIEPFDDDNGNSNDSKKRRRSMSDTFDCEMCPEIFLNHEQLASHYRNVHNTNPQRMFKRMKVESSPLFKAKKKIRDRENYECKNCQKQFCTKVLYLDHVNMCTRKSVAPTTSILEAHLKGNSQQQQQQMIKREEPEPMLCETNLNIPDFNLFEDINMQLSGQKPVPSLMPLGGGQASGKSSKYSRKDSRKVYDESTNTECTCEVCGKQWPAKKHLWQHLIRFHRSEAAVTCGVCLKLCVTYDDLSEHLKNIHPSILSTAGNNFTCKICGRYHNARSKLLLHMSIHINCKGNILCQRCNRTFENDEKLKEHIATCMGAREGDNASESLISKEDNEEKGSLIGDEDDDDVEEENEFESEEESAARDSDNNDSSSDKSNDSDSSSNSSNSSSDDDDNSDDEDGSDAERPRNHEEDSSKDSGNVVELPQPVNVKTEVQTMNLGVDEEEEEEEEEEDDDEKPRYEPALSESDDEDDDAHNDDEYLKKQQQQQQREIKDRYQLSQKEPMLVNYSEDDGPPALSPMLAAPTQSNEHNNDGKERIRLVLDMKKEQKSDSSAEESSNDEDSDDEEVPQAQVVDPNSAFHTDNSRSSNEGEEEQEEEQEVEGEQEEGEVEIADAEEEEDVDEQEHERHEEQEEHDGQEMEEAEEEEVMNDEAEVLEVDENDMHNLNGTVLMLANDADGNQILIERNMADLENDDSVHDMAQYVFQDGTGFALEDYEAIVEGSQEDDEQHQQSFEMEMSQAQDEEEEEEEEVEEQDEEMHEEVEEEEGEEDEVEVDEVPEEEEEGVVEDDVSAKS